MPANSGSKVAADWVPEKFPASARQDSTPRRPRDHHYGRAIGGALRLKQVPNVMRQKIGSDYRLLFRLHPDRVQVIDLINRKDLDCRLKTLV